MKFWQRWKEGLQKSSLTQKIKSVWTHRRIKAETLDDLEDLLIESDIGVQTVEKLRDNLSGQKWGDISFEGVCQTLITLLVEKLKPFEKELIVSEKRPFIVLVAGVNGSGKTTTLSKLSLKWQQEGYRVAWAACDTFRAAAVDQLAVWAERLSIPLYQGQDAQDPASVAYEAIQKAQKENMDILCIDTAGRLHTNLGLMDELKKIVRVIQKINPEFPHESILVLDGTVGQNAIQQLKLFKEVLPLTGIIMTKLDGTARGGVLVRLMEECPTPIYGVGLGEKAEDYIPFDAEAFVKGLLGEE